MKTISIDNRMLWVTSCLTKHQLLYKHYIPLQITRRAKFSGVFEVESLEMMTKRILCYTNIFGSFLATSGVFGYKKYFLYHHSWAISLGFSSAKHMAALESVFLICEAHER